MTATIRMEPEQAITTRVIDATPTAVEVNGELLAFAYQDPNIRRWKIQDRECRTCVGPGDFDSASDASGLIAAHPAWFDLLAPPQQRDSV